MKSRYLATAALVACAALAGCQSPGYSQLASPTPSASLATPGDGSVPPSKTYLGVYEKGVPGNYQPVADFAKTIGRDPQLTLYFSGWGEPFQTSFAEQAIAHGTMTVVQMNPTNVDMRAIAKGRFDTYLKSFADQVKAFGHPVVIGFAHEMNGWWYSWGWTHTSPRVWVAAWRHVVKVFRKRHVRHVKWLWTINRGVGGRYGPPKDYWPGVRYVSWVGIDSYYFTRKQNFTTTFGPTIEAVRAFTHKPILLGETAIGQKAGQKRMIPDLFAGIRRYNLIGLIWYDVAQHGGRYHQDWRLEGHDAAIAVFQRKVAAMLRR